MIPARDAVILWDKDLKKVMVRSKDEKDTPEMAKLSKSGGAAWGFWREASPDELYFRLLQQFAGMVRDDGIPAEVVHKAFLVIPEYVASLPPSQERDDWVESGFPAEPAQTFSEGYPL